MAAISQEAGPEWAYLAPLTSRQRLPFGFDLLYIKVQRHDEEPATKIDSIQVLCRNQGSNSVDFDLYFEAYEGAMSDVAISDASSFRRLLVAIGHLGLAAPELATASTEFPPVLRFFAKPKDAETLPAIHQSPEKDRRENKGRRQYVRDLSETPERHGNTPAPEDNSMRRENAPSRQDTTRHDDTPLSENTSLTKSGKAIEVINIHEGKDYGENLKRFINGNPEQFGLGTIVVVPITSTVLPSVEDLREKPERPLKTQPSLICIDEVHSIGSTSHLTVEWIQRLIYRARYPVHVLALSGSPWKYGPSDFDVIESIALDELSISAWWGRDVYDQYKWRLKTARANLNESAKQVSRMDIVGQGMRGNIRDEDKTDANEILKRHDQALREYAAQIPLLQRKERSIYLGYFIPGTKKAEIQTVIFDSGMNDAQKLVANDYKEFLRVSHRKEVQTWSRKPESTRGPRPKIKSRLFSLDAGSTHSSRIEVSLVGFAPGLAQHILERTKEPQLKFRSAEANKIFGKTTTATQRQAVRTSRYWGLAQTAFYKVDPKTGEKALHPKVDFIVRTIEKMLKDEEPHVKDNVLLGVFPKMMIIVVPHPFQGLLLAAYLFNRFRDHIVTFVGSGNETNKNRPALLAPFQRSTTRKHPEDGRSGDPIALISTYDIIGVGLNLTRCNYLIATSPLGSKANQDQQFGRIDRQGQYATVHGWVLADHGNPVDVTTFYRMKKRTALTVSPDEIGSGLNFLLDDIDQEDVREPDADDDMDDAN